MTYQTSYMCFHVFFLHDTVLLHLLFWKYMNKSHNRVVIDFSDALSKFELFQFKIWKYWLKNRLEREWTRTRIALEKMERNWNLRLRCQMRFHLVNFMRGRREEIFYWIIMWTINWFQIAKTLIIFAFENLTQTQPQEKLQTQKTRFIWYKRKSRRESRLTVFDNLGSPSTIHIYKYIRAFQSVATMSIKTMGKDMWFDLANFFVIIQLIIEEIGDFSLTPPWKWRFLAGHAGQGSGGGSKKYSRHVGQGSGGGSKKYSR